MSKKKMKVNRKAYKSDLDKTNQIINIVSCLVLLVSAFVIAFKEYED